jgi:hypothetical protein
VDVLGAQNALKFSWWILSLKVCLSS